MERKSRRGRGEGEGGRERGGGGVGGRVKQGEERVHSRTGHTHGCAGSFKLAKSSWTTNTLTHHCQVVISQSMFHLQNCSRGTNRSIASTGGGYLFGLVSFKQTINPMYRNQLN